MIPDWAGYLRFRDRIAEAIDQRRYPLAWLDMQVLSGAVRVWSNDTAAIVAEIKFYPSGVCDVHGLVAAGELDGIRALIPLAEMWGREWGALDGLISSRPGWAKALADYEVHQVTVRKGL